MEKFSSAASANLSTTSVQDAHRGVTPPSQQQRPQVPLARSTIRRRQTKRAVRCMCTLPPFRPSLEVNSLGVVSALQEKMVEIRRDSSKAKKECRLLMQPMRDPVTELLRCIT